jgi:ferredoxin
MPFKQLILPASHFSRIQSGRGPRSAVPGTSKTKPKANPKDLKSKKAPLNEIEVTKEKETKGKEPPAASDPNQRKSFQQLQDEKKRIREGEEFLQSQIELEAGFLMGAPCESRICSACEVIVEEFGLNPISFSSISLSSSSIAQAVYAGISDPKYQYIYDITDDFCERKEVKEKYIPLVGNLCPKLLEVS